jgi:hypothetical protein
MKIYKNNKLNQKNLNSNMEITLCSRKYKKCKIYAEGYIKYFPYQRICKNCLEFGKKDDFLPFKK